MARAELTISDLLAVARLPDAQGAESISRVFSWMYEHALGRARALAGLGSAALLATLLPAFQFDADTTVNWAAIVVTWIGSAALAGMGAITYVRARRFHAEYIRTLGLLETLRTAQANLARTQG